MLHLDQRPARFEAFRHGLGDAAVNHDPMRIAGLPEDVVPDLSAAVVHVKGCLRLII
jgi:hypothetical protein